MNAELTADDFVGRALGGVALTILRSLHFLADAASFVVSAVLLNRAIPDSQPETDGSSAWQDLRVGLRWFLGNPVLRMMTILIASLAFCQGAVYGLLPLFAKQDLHLSNSAYGLLLAVASIGAVVGAFAASRIHDWIGSGRTILLAGTIAAIGYPALALTRSPAVASMALLVEASMVIVGNVAARSLRQKIVPANMQGRAASAYSAIITSSIPLGALTGGLLAGATSMKSAILVAVGIQVSVLALYGPRLVARIKTAGAVGATVIDLVAVSPPVADDLELIEAG
jgi:predicted MFS family arabinose efflux permease